MKELRLITHEQELFAEALSGFELMGLPDSPEFATGSERLSRLGEMVVFRAGWGTYLPTIEVIEALRRGGLLSERLEGQLVGLGFEGGYRLGPQVDMFSHEAQMMQAGWASRLAQTAIEARGWDKVKAVYLGTSTMSQEAIYKTRANLEEMGIEVGKIWHHSLACQSWTTGLVGALTESELEGERVVVVGMDTLAGNVANPYQPITYATFGDGGGAIALIPGKEMRYLNGRTRVEYDMNGVTTATLAKRLPERHLWKKVPEGFEIVGENTLSHFVVTDEGMFLEVPDKPGSKMIWMDGVGTFKYFVIEGQAPEMVAEQIEWYESSLYRKRSGELGVAFGHQPSFEVMKGVNKRLERILRKNGRELDGYEFTWVMDQTKFNNVSAGTGLIAWEEMVHRGMIGRGKAHVILGLGVGATVGAHVVEIL